MCGRFTLRTPTPVLIEHFGLGRIPALPMRFNIAPTQDVTVVRCTADEGREAAAMRWGLVPAWAKDPAIGNRMINARAETVAEKPAFRAAFRRRRCLVMADGFYEWQKKLGRGKRPHYIQLEGSGPLAFAGLWECWQEEVESCTIITTDANELIRQIHDRMPVILSPADYNRWLDVNVQDRDELEPLLRPYPAAAMTMHPVSTHVNSPRNDDPECIEPEQQRLF